LCRRNAKGWSAVTTPDHHFVFVGGMHRSGTTALCHMIATHPQISGFTNTGVIEDEGQYLQSVYPTEDSFGGAGRFGLHPQSHLTEDSPLVPAAKQSLFDAWSPYWDLSKPFLCEKTPSNIVRSRFLQAAFPSSTFIFVSRHPAAQALAVLKFDKNVPLTSVIRNWLACHRYLTEDLPHLRRSLLLRYDDISTDPAATCRSIETLLGLEPGMNPGLIRSALNDPYYASWRKGDYRLWGARWRNLVKRWRNKAEIAYIESHFESAINGFGYSFREIP
jgi:hypothetical protein